MVIKDDYILVTLDGDSALSILQIFTYLLTQEALASKPTIWVLSLTQEGMADHEISALKEFILKNLPPERPGRKTAIVARTDFHRSIAGKVVDVVSDLPGQFRVFPSLADAEAWVMDSP